MLKQHKWRFLPSVLCLIGTMTVASGAGSAAGEPSYERAVALWPDMRRPVTFLGCKDHPDEFAVMWNGNISTQTPTATDADRRLFQDRKDDALQMSFSVGTRPGFGNRNDEDGTTAASLLEGHLPIAVIRTRKDGMAVVQEAFVSDEHGKCVAGVWNAPVFLRMRFTVEQTGEDSAPVRLWAQVAANHTSYHTSTRRNIRILPVAPLYHRQLHQDGDSLLDSRGFVVMTADRTFRFHAQLPSPLSSIALQEFQLDRNVAEFELPRRKGATVELILPFVPASVEKVAAVRRHPYQQALELARECWKGEIGRGMQVTVPEESLNELWRSAAPVAFITADAYPNGERILKTAPHQYEACWVTLMAINVEALTRMGYLAEAAAYLKPFLDSKRRRPVPNTGASYLSASGFLSGPGEHVAINWVSDHGAILWAASEYFLLTRDAAFLRQWLPTLLEGVDWISKEREQTKRAGGRGAGLMPPGRATDAEMQSHFVWSDAWTYRGLDAVCRVMKAIGHQDATRLEREREDYRSVFQEAFRAQIRRTIRWLDPAGAEIPFIPYELSQTGAEQLHAFYLDTGPMVLGVAGLIDPRDETMTWAMKWLTEGPDSGKAFPDWSDYRERPSLRFEMSSSEPGYSWNIALRFLRNERIKFLEGFYSLAAGAVSRKFKGGVETRDGIHGVPLTNAVINMHLRNMLIFEDAGHGGIELLRNSPSTWLRPGQQIRVERAQTYFGTMGFQIRSAGSRVEAEIELPTHTQVQWIKLHLHHPEGRPLRGARVNGATVPTAGTDSLVIQKPSTALKVVAEF
jgi:hypothetical protein